MYTQLHLLLLLVAAWTGPAAAAAVAAAGRAAKACRLQALRLLLHLLQRTQYHFEVQKMSLLLLLLGLLLLHGSCNPDPAETPAASAAQHDACRCLTLLLIAWIDC